MDTLVSYREKIVAVFRTWESWPGDKAHFAIESVIDEKQDRYILANVGWDGYRRLYGTLVHIDILDGKLWIQKDDTEEGIATELLKAGIPSDRIVLAFKHPSLRPYTEFAAA